MPKKFLGTILIFLLTTTVAPRCFEGCLSCRNNTECVLADISSFYVLSNATAVKSKVKNCHLLSPKDNCQICKAGYFKDPTTAKCAPLTPEIQIAHCLLYLSLNTCHECEEGYYVATADDVSQCKANAPSIDHCNAQFDNLCKNCETGWVPSIDELSCRPRPAAADCFSFSYVQCLECLPGFGYSLNGKFRSFAESVGSESWSALTVFLEDIEREGEELRPFDNCYEKDDVNCVESGSGGCLECGAGFLVVNGFCVESPVGRLKNCRDYVSLDECKECEQGYYFQSDECVEVADGDAIASCTEYDGFSSNVICLKCSDSHFLSSNSCVQRVDSSDGVLTNCLRKNVEKDECEKCDDLFVLAENDTKCKSAVPNCRVYSDIDDSGPLKCESCQNGFYLKIDGNGVAECDEGLTDNCADYTNDSSTDCLRCENGYYLLDNVCSKSDELDKCAIYHPTDKARCQQCDKNTSFNFIIQKKCRDITNLISHCRTYNGGTVDAPLCGECDNGYELKNNICEEIAITNCIETNGDECSLCGIHFSLTDDKSSCENPPNYISNGCDVDNISNEGGDTLFEEVECLICEENHYPINLENQFVCLTIQEMGFIEEGTETIDGCLKYDNDFKCVMCDPSGNKPYLSNSQPYTCLSNCDSESTEGSYKKMVLDISAEGVEINNWNVCTDQQTDNGCLIYAADIDNNNLSDICVKCKDNYIAVINISSSSYTVIDPESDNPELYIPSFFSKYPKVSCTPSGSVSVIDNCRYYVNANDVPRCLKCKNGFSSLPVEQGEPGDGHLSQCTADAECQNNQLTNLPTIWSNLFSCHKCKTNGKIPFLAINKQGPTDFSFKNFGFFNLDPPFLSSSADSLKTVFCVENSPSAFGLSSVGDYGVSPNCALGVLFIDSVDGKTDYDAGKIGVSCAACKAGFKPTKVTNSDLIKNCSPITGCSKKGQSANICEECNIGFAFLYTGGDVDFTTCVEIPTFLKPTLINCLSGEFVGSTMVCRECKKGFEMNSDGFCESVELVNCVSGFSRQPGQVSKHRIGWRLFQQDQPVGCNKCEENRFPVKISTEQCSCVQSKWIEDHIDEQNPNSTEFIPNCLKYSANLKNGYKCGACKEGFVIEGNNSQDIIGEHCFSDQTLQNCTVASSATHCVSCKSNFSLVNNNCVKPFNIYGCVTFEFDVNNSEGKCRKCLSGKYKTSDGKCENGLVKNCALFEVDSANNCLACEANFIKVTVKDNNSYCFPIDNELGCSEFDTIVGSEAAIACTACYESDSKLPDLRKNDEPGSFCSDFIAQPYCVQYTNTGALNTSSFKCSLCEQPGYYIDTQFRCPNRYLTPDNCKTEKLDADTCEICADNYYIAEGGLTCRPAPTGLPGCAVFADPTTCLECRSDSYLNNGQCKKIEIPIPHCEFYELKDVCGRCVAGRWLVNNACVTPNATDCKEFASFDACSDCHSMHKLEETNGIVNCVLAVIFGCKDVNIHPPHECLSCAFPFFPHNGGCTSIVFSSPFPFNCKELVSQQICKQCNDTYTLSADKANCIRKHENNLAVSNCKHMVQSETPLCSLCKPGYQFANGTCVPHCVGPNSAGCALCNPGNTSTCLVCQPSHFAAGAGCRPIQDCYVPDCLACLPGDKEHCSQCRPGFLTTGALCAPTCLGGDKQNCAECGLTNRTTCIRCKNGFLLEDGICRPVCADGADPFCLLCDGPGGGCLKCIDGYFERDGICASNCVGVGKDNCKSCDEEQPERCLVCVDGYVLRNNFCVPRCGDAGLENCTLCPEQGGRCAICDDGFVLNDGFCAKLLNCSINGCLSCASDGGCLICKAEFDLDGGGCVPAAIEEPCVGGGCCKENFEFNGECKCDTNRDFLCKGGDCVCEGGLCTCSGDDCECERKGGFVRRVGVGVFIFVLFLSNLI